MSAIFLCYRRDDAAGYVHAIRDRLAARLDPEQIFMDIDSIEPGFDFAEVIERSVASCSVLLALIGKRWSPEKLQDSRDFVRLEIQTALEKKIRVIPVLLDGAEMPKPEALPAELAPLSRRQAYEVSNQRFSHDAEGLADQVEKILREKKSKKSAPPKPKSAPPKPKSAPPKPKSAPPKPKSAPPKSPPPKPKSPPPPPLSRRRVSPPPPKPRVLKADPLGETPFETPALVWLKRLGGILVYLFGIVGTLAQIGFVVSAFAQIETAGDELSFWLMSIIAVIPLWGWILRILRSSRAWMCFRTAGVLQILFPIGLLILEPSDPDSMFPHEFMALMLGILFGPPALANILMGNQLKKEAARFLYEG